MKKIAVFMGDTSGEFQAEIIAAVEEEAKVLGVSVYVFTNAGVYGANAFYTQGEKNIIYLPYLEDYDGIIVAGDTFGIDVMYEELAMLLEKEARCPVVCLRQKDERFSNILVDDYDAMCNIVKHFIEEHGYTKIYFMTGKLEMYDAQRRLLAYIDTMYKYGLRITPEMIFEGDYWSNKGDEALDWFLKDEDNWPQAIVCANDYMAISVCDALNRRGIKIPSQIAVSGYDDVEESKFSIPPLTTVQINCGEIGKAAFQLLKDLYETKESRRDVYIKGEPIYRSSCCNVFDWNQESAKKLLAEKEFIKQSFYTHTSMGIAFDSEDDFENLIHVAYEYIKGKGYERVYVCLCDGNDVEQEGSALQQKYSEKMVLKAIINPDSCEYKEESFSRRELLPAQYRKENDLMYVHPFHGQNKCLGYVVMKSRSLQRLRFFLTRWVQEMGGALERQMIYEESKELMELRSNYHKDPLTGIGNRREMDRILLKYSNAIIATGGFCIISADMDDLKQINDCYGHLEGDIALCEIAGILKKVVGKQGVATRIGGDEFLVCLQTNKQEDAERVTKEIQESVLEYNKNSGKPWYLHISIGYAFCRNRNSILMTMEQADKNMYEAKRIWKSSREYKGEAHE
ncbi:MAG: GGDEF domain-containing protein [Lachnospiraceae bacterium]|nr:GGDEF domain-containing protein [Lachnospiraceae bacterium]